MKLFKTTCIDVSGNKFYIKFNLTRETFEQSFCDYKHFLNISISKFSQMTSIKSINQNVFGSTYSWNTFKN